MAEPERELWGRGLPRGVVRRMQDHGARRRERARLLEAIVTMDTVPEVTPK